MATPSINSVSAPAVNVMGKKLSMSVYGLGSRIRSSIRNIRSSMPPYSDEPPANYTLPEIRRLLTKMGADEVTIALAEGWFHTRLAVLIAMMLQGTVRGQRGAKSIKLQRIIYPAKVPPIRGILAPIQLLAALERHARGRRP